VGEVWCATGRRKTSVARVRLRLGDGKLNINGKEAEEYLKRSVLKFVSEQPLLIAEYVGKVDVDVNVRGGGLSGQAGAISHGICKALILHSYELRPQLKKAGLVTRDSRGKERKKYGQKGARARFQFSKR